MSTTEVTPKRASFEELLTFANKVRAAGGGNPLDALMPAVPQDGSQCLIALNLNFNCIVEGISRDDLPEHEQKKHEDYAYVWGMHVESIPTGEKIAEELGLTGYLYDERTYVVVLPPEIGQVAYHFDRWLDSPDSQPDMTPYVEASIREAYTNVDDENINDDGSIVL